MSRAPWNTVLHASAGAAGLPYVNASATVSHRRLHIVKVNNTIKTIVLISLLFWGNNGTMAPSIVLFCFLEGEKSWL